MNKTDCNIQELVENASAGDRNCIEQLFKVSYDQAYCIALRLVGNAYDAQDILHDSYIIAIEKIGNLEKPESFVSWFNTIVANKAKDYIKKKKPELFGDTADCEEFLFCRTTESYTEIENIEALQAIRAAVDSLTAEKKRCVILFYYEEMSVAQISAALRIPVNTVKSRLYLARRDIATRL